MVRGPIDDIFMARVSESSRVTYRSSMGVLRAYMEEVYPRGGVELDASFIREFLGYDMCVAGFIEWCVSTRELGFSSITAYLSGLRFWGTDMEGCPPPLSDFVWGMLRGVKNREGDGKRPKRPPVSPQLLADLVQLSPQQLGWDLYDTLMFRAVVTIAFQGCMRVSEYLVSRDKRKWLRACNIQVGTPHGRSREELWITLGHTKTNQSGKKAVVELLAFPGDPICPVKNWKAYRKVRGPVSSPDEVVFRNRKGKPLSQHWLNARLRHAVAVNGGDPVGFSSHSLRIGAADTVGANKTSKEVLLALGRWSLKGCDSAEIYLREKSAMARAREARALLSSL